MDGTKNRRNGTYGTPVDYFGFDAWILINLVST